MLGYYPLGLGLVPQQEWRRLLIIVVLDGLRLSPGVVGFHLDRNTAGYLHPQCPYDVIISSEIRMK